MKVKKSSKKKTIASFIIGTLLMFSIVISVISVFTKFIVLNPDTYINILEKNKIYSEMYDFLDGNLEYAIVINSVDATVKDGIISEEDLKSEVNSSIRSFINYFTTGINEIKEVNVDKYMNRFDNNFNNYIQQNSIFINENAQKEIDLLRQEVEQIIKSELQMFNMDIVVKASSVNIIARLISIFVKGFYLTPIALIAILILTLNFIWKNNIIRFFQWIGNGLLAAGLFIFILFFSGYISGFYNNVIINIAYLKHFISSVIKNWLFILSLMGVLISILGTLFLIPIIKNYIKRSKMIRKDKNM